MEPALQCCAQPDPRWVDSPCRAAIAALSAAYAKLLPSEGLGLSGLDEGTPLSLSSTSSEWSLASFLARANYTLFSKYLFTASFRADGSSRFAQGSNMGLFSFCRFRLETGIGKMDEVDIRFLSDAKLRASWGITGNNNVGNFSYLRRL